MIFFNDNAPVEFVAGVWPVPHKKYQ